MFGIPQPFIAMRLVEERRIDVLMASGKRRRARDDAAPCVQKRRETLGARRGSRS